MQTDFVDVPPGGDTSIRCVVQPPPDMLATHVCVEVGLVKSPGAAAAAAAANDDPDKPEMPTIVVCSVDVEPCRTAPEPSGKRAAAASGRVGDDDDDDVLDRISQDLDYLLNREHPATTGPDCGADRKPKKQQQQRDTAVVHEVPAQKRTKL